MPTARVAARIKVARNFMKTSQEPLADGTRIAESSGMLVGISQSLLAGRALSIAHQGEPRRIARTRRAAQRGVRRRAHTGPATGGYPRFGGRLRRKMVRPGHDRNSLFVRPLKSAVPRVIQGSVTPFMTSGCWAGALTAHLPSCFQTAATAPDWLRAAQTS